MRIKVGDDTLDSYRNEIIAQNYAVNEIGDIATRQGGFSNEFDVPLTAKNREILGVPDDINSTSRNPYEKVDASLVDQGTTVATGYLRYQTVEEDNQIKVSFFSDNVEWFSLLKDKTLNDLDLSEFNHDWDAVAIEASINADKSSGYTYPLIDYGELKELTTLTIDVSQIFPCIFCSTLVTKMFFDIGWKVEGEMIDSPKYQRMVIPFSAKSFSHDQDYIDDFSSVVPKDVDQIAGSGGTNPATMTWEGGIVSVDPLVNGFYQITVRLNIDDASIIFPPTTYDVEVTIGVTTIILETGLDTYGEVIEFTYTVDGSDVFGFLTPTFHPLQVIVTCAVNSMTILSSDSSVTFDLLPKIAAGSEIQFSQIVPNITQSDFLKYLVFIFGAVPQANNLSKTVNFGFFRSIKGNIPNALDWSSKLDISKSRSIDFTELLDKYKSISTLRYADDDNDNELTSYAADTDRTFGDGQFDIDNEHIAGKETIYEAPFSPMININSFNNTMYIPQIIFKVTGENDVEPAPKIALLSENISVSTLSSGRYADLIINDDDEYTTVSIPSIPFCWFAKTKYIATVDLFLDSLDFDHIQLPNPVGLPIIDQFLKDYEEILNSVKYKKDFFHLTETDINELNFLIPIFIDRYKAYFYISKTNNYKGSLETTEAELVKIADG